METIKIVINCKYGRFNLSDAGKVLYKELSGKDINIFECDRTDPHLIEVIERLGDKVNKRTSDLRIKNIPSVFKDCYLIVEYDGSESIDLSSHLLINHKLKQIDVETLTLDQCKETLLRLQNISSTDYSQMS